jgi:hypothetical protein
MHIKVFTENDDISCITSNITTGSGTSRIDVKNITPSNKAGREVPSGFDVPILGDRYIYLCHTDISIDRFDTKVVDTKINVVFNDDNCVPNGSDIQLYSLMVAKEKQSLNFGIITPVNSQKVSIQVQITNVSPAMVIVKKGTPIFVIIRKGSISDEFPVIKTPTIHPDDNLDIILYEVSEGGRN